MNSFGTIALGSNRHYFKLLPKKDGNSRLPVKKEDYLDACGILKKVGYDVLDSGYSQKKIVVSLDKPIDPGHLKELRHVFRIEEDSGDDLVFRRPYGVAKQFILASKSKYREVEIAGMKACILAGFENLGGKVIEEESHLAGRIIGLKEEDLDKPNWFTGECRYPDGSEIGGHLPEYEALSHGFPTMEKAEKALTRFCRRFDLGATEVGNLDALKLPPTIRKAV